MAEVKEIKQYGFVIKELVSREIKRKYARSYFGILWSVLQPLLSMAVLSMIFSTIFKHSIENFPIYYLTGSIIWNMFTEATNAAMTALVDNKMLLMKVKLPLLVFPLSRVLTALINMGYAFIAYILMLVVFGVKFQYYMFYFPIIIFFEFIFAIGFGNILSVAYVFFGDVKHLYSVLLTLWMYCSAIFYPISGLSSSMQRLVSVNPIYNFIACARNCMMYAKAPNNSEIVQMMLWGGGVYLIGHVLFMRTQKYIMQRL